MVYDLHPAVVSIKIAIIYFTCANSSMTVYNINFFGQRDQIIYKIYINENS